MAVALGDLMMIKIKKVDKQITITLILLIPIFLLEVSLVVANTLHPLPAFIFYLPFFTTSVYIISIFLVRNLIYHYRIVYLYISISLLTASMFYTYFFVKLGIMYEGIVGWIIFTFMGLFYGAFLWDFFMGFSYFEKVLNTFKKRIYNYLEKNTNDNCVFVEGLDARNFFKIDIKKDKRSILSIVTVVFLLPFALLGKGAAYFLGVGLSQYFDAHAYVLSAICFPGTLFFLMLFLPPTIALWRLKYPKV